MGTLAKTTGRGDLVVDETSCGPMCQHPSCWASNQRREKGFPLRREASPVQEALDTDLPNVAVYNMLAEYGDDCMDRFPAKHSGRPSHTRVLSSLPALPSSSLSHVSVRLNDSIPGIVGSSHSTSEAKKSPHMKVVEVQEVFDVEDLNNQWDETFITKQYYVWVPNPKKPLLAPKTADKTISVSKVTSQPQPIPSKDVTEQLIPEEVERQREDARVFDAFPVLKRKYASAHSGSSRGMVYSRGTGQRSARPHIDADSLQELLDLPKDVLMSVLEHMEETDLLSRDKVHSVVKHFRSPTESQPSPVPTPMGTSEMLRQKKVQLLGSKERNYRNPDLMMTRPVFQLDRGQEIEKSSGGQTPVREVASESSVGDLHKYKKPLPGIGASSMSKSDGGAKVASISLGLPELPSGLRQTRPFTYKKQQYIDFSLGPVPTPPLTSRSSDTGGSDHGTTMRVNMTSASTRLQDRDIYGRYSREGTPLTESSMPLHSMSPSMSSKLPKTPMVTPATHSSPTKMSFQRDRTSASQNVSRSPPPSRDITMSPVQKMIAPANSPNQSPAPSPEPGTRGLVTIPEMLDDRSSRHFTPGGKIVSFVCEVPVPPPASTEEQNTYTISLSHLSQPAESLPKASPRQDNPGTELNHRRSQSPVSASSCDEWPDVNEASFQNAGYPTPDLLQYMTDQPRPVSERGSRTPASKPRSSVASRESDKSSIARMMMDESVKTESPGPPPPSPEPKDRKKTEERKSQELMSRESATMAPLYEESETGEALDQEKSDRFDPGVVMTVSEVTPQPGRRGIAVDTFVTVDIQASKTPRDNAVDGTDENTLDVSGQGTERTATEQDEEEDAHQDRDFNENRAASDLSRETTNLRNKEPESVAGAPDVEAVDYENHNQSQQESELQGTTNETSLGNHVEDESQSVVVEQVDQPQMEVSSQDTNLPEKLAAPSGEQAPVGEEHLNLDSQSENVDATENQTNQEVSDEQQEVEVDVNIPPPVSRTNTAIEIVRNVMESAAANVEEINQEENQ